MAVIRRTYSDLDIILDSFIQNGKAGLVDWLAYLRACVNNVA